MSLFLSSVQKPATSFRARGQLRTGPEWGMMISIFCWGVTHCSHRPYEHFSTPSIKAAKLMMNSLCAGLSVLFQPLDIQGRNMDATEDPCDTSPQWGGTRCLRFSTWIKCGKGDGSVLKAKSILAPSDPGLS